jgi:hypothetical protein
MTKPYATIQIDDNNRDDDPFRPIGVVREVKVTAPWFNEIGNRKTFYAVNLLAPQGFSERSYVPRALVDGDLVYPTVWGFTTREEAEALLDKYFAGYEDSKIMSELKWEFVEGKDGAKGTYEWVDHTDYSLPEERGEVVSGSYSHDDWYTRRAESGFCE